MQGIGIMISRGVAMGQISWILIIYQGKYTLLKSLSQKTF